MIFDVLVANRIELKKHSYCNIAFVKSKIVLKKSKIVNLQSSIPNPLSPVSTTRTTLSAASGYPDF